MTELACYLLMFSHTDWKRMLGPAADVEDFLTRVWEEAKSFDQGDPVTWVELQVERYKS
ncbi:MAG: hypothetical protein TR69_WS6001000520 [candidate division WS6 bacterium OLB20]|uniref:Uncharacterized protein n=1 Tax=candidate division WS6 bacterium OLB20 TaxID=1617426 RepID=A0A136LY15_9BACT|nr:MAG: hypothetical protein TR69_WS6001000520 [candidate division WS6 bacterium OLB20]